jgi:hypothetical protein
VRVSYQRDCFDAELLAALLNWAAAFAVRRGVAERRDIIASLMFLHGIERDIDLADQSAGIEFQAGFTL